MLTVGQLRKTMNGMPDDRQVIIRQGGWIYGTAFAETAVITPDENGGFENDGPRTPDDYDVLLFGVIE